VFYGSNSLVKFTGHDYGSYFTETNFMSILGLSLRSNLWVDCTCCFYGSSLFDRFTG